MAGSVFSTPHRTNALSRHLERQQRTRQLASSVTFYAVEAHQLTELRVALEAYRQHRQPTTYDELLSDLGATTCDVLRDASLLADR